MMLTRWFTLYMFFAIFALAILPGCVFYAVQGEFTTFGSVFSSLWAVLFMIIGIAAEGQIVAVVSYWIRSDELRAEKIRLQEIQVQIKTGAIESLRDDISTLIKENETKQYGLDNCVYCGLAYGKFKAPSQWKSIAKMNDEYREMVKRLGLYERAITMMNRLLKIS